MTGLVALLGIVGAEAAPGQTGDAWPITRVSVGTGGTEAYGSSERPSISADGRFVAFESNAPNLVAGDTNDAADIFLHDRLTGETSRISVSSDGAQAGSHSQWATISADGTLVVFESMANDLVPGDTANTDVFVRDLAPGVTTRVSVADNGDEADGDSGLAALSADGRYVAFASSADNLVAGDDNGQWDVFLRDRLVPGTTRVSVATGGAQGNGTSAEPALSSDGRYVAFRSQASNLVAGDTNGWADVFLHDRVTGETTRISVPAGGGEGDEGSYSPSLSADASLVAFSSFASNLVPGDTNGVMDVFVLDRTSGTLARISLNTAGDEGDGASGLPLLTRDGRFVAFVSNANNFDPGDSNGMGDVYLRDLSAGTTSRVSKSWDGSQLNFPCSGPGVSEGGTAVVFETLSTNVVPEDFNFAHDVFASPGPVFVAGFETGDLGEWTFTSP